MNAVGPGREPADRAVERQVQALISSLARRLTEEADEEAAKDLAGPGRRRAPGSEAPMVLVSIAQHADHAPIVATDDTPATAVRVRTIEHSLTPSSPLIRARMATEESVVGMLENVGLLADAPLFLRVSYHLSADFARISEIQRNRPAPSATTPEAFASVFGAPLGEVRSSVEAVRSDTRTATALRVGVGAVMMLREMVLVDVHGVVRELSFTHFRADRVALSDG